MTSGGERSNRRATGGRGRGAARSSAKKGRSAAAEGSRSGSAKSSGGLGALLRRLGLWRAPRTLGARGEAAAAKHLRRGGYRIQARNLHIGPGEADLVALAPDKRTIVIVEVKTRLVGPDHPPPEGSITARKRRVLIGVAQAVARKGGWLDRPLRIDVVAIDWPSDPPGRRTGRGRPEIRHYVNAVTAGR